LFNLKQTQRIKRRTKTVEHVKIALL